MEHSLRHHVGAHGEEGRWQVLLITATDDIAPGVAPWNDSQIIVSQVQTNESSLIWENKTKRTVSKIGTILK